MKILTIKRHTGILDAMSLAYEANDEKKILNFRPRRNRRAEQSDEIAEIYNAEIMARSEAFRASNSQVQTSMNNEAEV